MKGIQKATISGPMPLMPRHTASQNASHNNHDTASVDINRRDYRHQVNVIPTGAAPKPSSDPSNIDVSRKAVYTTSHTSLSAPQRQPSNQVVGSVTPATHSSSGRPIASSKTSQMIPSGLRNEITASDLHSTHPATPRRSPSSAALSTLNHTNNQPSPPRPSGTTPLRINKDHKAQAHPARLASHTSTTSPPQPARVPAIRSRHNVDSIHGENISLDCGKLLRAYEDLLDSVDQNDPRRIRRRGQAFLAQVNGVVRKLEELPAAVRADSVFATAIIAVEFSGDNLNNHLDKAADNLDNPSRYCKSEQARELAQMLWSSLKGLVDAGVQQHLFHDLQVLGLYSNSENVNPDLARLTAVAEHSKRVSVMTTSTTALKKSLLSYAATFMRAHEKRSASRANTGKHESHHDPECLGWVWIDNPTESTTFVELDGFKLSLRSSRIFLSGVPSRAGLDAVGFPRPSSERTDVLRDKKQNVVSATIPAYVRILTDTIEIQEEEFAVLLDILFHSFRCFATPQSLLEIIKSRYLDGLPSGLNSASKDCWSRHQRVVKLHVILMLVTWLRQFWVEEHDQDIHVSLQMFATCTTERDTDIPRQAHTLFVTAINERNPMRRNRVSKRQELLNQAEDDKENRLTLFHARVGPLEEMVKRGTLYNADVLLFLREGGAEELARQLTLKEWDLFHAFVPVELVMSTKAEKEFSQWGCFMQSFSLAVVDSILDHLDVHKRAEVIEMFISVAYYCKHMRNYNSAHAIVTALDTPASVRLDKTWSILSDKHKKRWDKLKDFFFEGNKPSYTKYREELREPRPAIPCFMAIIEDMKRIYAGIRNTRDYPLEKRLIPFVDMRELSTLAKDFELCYGAYYFPRYDAIHKWIDHFRRLFVCSAWYTELSIQLTRSFVTVEPAGASAFLHRRSWISEEDRRKAQEKYHRMGFEVQEVKDMVESRRRNHADASH